MFLKNPTSLINPCSCVGGDFLNSNKVFVSCGTTSTSPHRPSSFENALKDSHSESALDQD